MNDVKAFLTSLPVWQHKNTPREFFLGMAGLIGLGILTLVTDFQFISVPLIIFLFLGAFWGARMLYQNREVVRPEGWLLPVTIGVMVASVATGFFLADRIGNPIESRNTPDYCQEAGLTLGPDGYCY